MNKYNATKTTIDGIKFDSKKEANRYLELKLLEKAGEIAQLELQPRYLLQPAFGKNSKKYRKIEYVADFQYLDMKTKERIVEDSKGFETAVFKMKKKMFEYTYQGLTLLIT
jgi:hypothetical protein